MPVAASRQQVRLDQVMQEAHALRARRGDELPARGRRQRVAARHVQQAQRPRLLLLASGSCRPITTAHRRH
jgi:hypothetical protein